MSEPIIGIDLGTTFSLVSVLEDDRPVVLPNALGERLTASAVSVAEDGKVLVGAPARARATTHPLQTVLSFKRDMGTDKIFTLGKHKFRPPELSALVLASLRRDAEAALGQPIREAVITVPAYFGDAQRQATRDAGAIAGLHVERIINEPTAAALSYGLHQRHRELRAVVLDLGGGTFDVTVLEILEGVIEIQSSAGDIRLGGDDFDDILTEYCADHLARQRKLNVRTQPQGMARLREAAEQARRRLSTMEQTRLALPALPVDGNRSIDFELPLHRTEAETLFAPLLARMQAPILRALADARVRPEQIEEVLLVGGATRMPCVARLATQLFGRLPLRSLPPDESIALGAAVQAGLKGGHAAVADMVVTDVAPFTLGIAVSSRFGSRHMPGIYYPLLERGTVIPASRIERFFAVDPNQTAINIEVYQGEHSLCKDNQKLGQYTIQDLEPTQEGPRPVDVRFSYDLNGILEVEMSVVGTDRTETLLIERTPGRLSRDEVHAARKAMERLKLHPRETLPAVTLLTRAEALFVEVTGLARQELGTAIAQFRLMLEVQDPAKIEAARQMLSAMVQALRRDGASFPPGSDGARR
jgi:molecular chaperone HscC